jgi:hypothetical protein
MIYGNGLFAALPKGIFMSVTLFLLAAIFYFVPFAVAQMRGQRNATAIFVLNLLLGWTLLGWVGALVWACTSNTDAAIQEKNSQSCSTVLRILSIVLVVVGAVELIVHQSNTPSHASSSIYNTPIYNSPIPTPASKEQQAEWDKEAKIYWENDRVRKEKEAEEAKELLIKREAIREANGDFSQTPGLTSEQKQEAEIKWAEKNAAESIKGAKPAPQ